MFDTMVDKHPALLIPILSVLGVTLVFVVWIVAHNWRKARQFEIEAGLKKDMLAREFTPADVERVLLASADRTEQAPAAQEAISDNEYYLVEKMLDAEYPVEEIERLVRAFKAGEKVALPGDERVMA